MCVYTFGFIVLSQVERTKYCLVKEHIEVFILLIIVNQFHLYVLFTMGKRAIIRILALMDSFRVSWTEFLFIGLIFVKLFNSGVSIGTSISIRALLLVQHFFTHIIRIVLSVTFPIHSIVKEYTLLMVVSLWVVTRLEFEYLQV